MDDDKRKEYEIAAENQRIRTIGRAFLIYLMMSGGLFVLCLLSSFLSGDWNSTWTKDPISWAFLNWFFIMLGGIVVMLPLSALIAWIITAKKIQALRLEYGVIKREDPTKIVDRETVKKNEEMAAKAIAKSGKVCAIVVIAFDLFSLPLVFLMEGYNLFYGCAGIVFAAICAVIAGSNKGTVCYAKLAGGTADGVPTGTRQRITIRAIVVAIVHGILGYVLFFIANNVSTVYLW